MKTIILFYLGVIAYTSILFSCNERTEIIDQSKNQTENNIILQEKDKALNEFGTELITLLRNESFRLLLKEEISKKFDYQNDIIYEFIKDKEIDTTHLKSSDLNSSKVAVKSLFSSNLKIERRSLFNRPIQISVPVNFDQWDPSKEIPPVVILPSDFNEATYEEIDAICSDGSVIKLATKKAPDFPVILICESERVDENMKLSVDENGILMAESDRLNAFDVYHKSDSNLKSANKDSEPLICIFDDTLPIAENQEKSVAVVQFIGSSEYQYSFGELIENNSIIQAPANDVISLTYSAANRIELDWPSIIGADGYYVAYMGSMDYNWNYKFFPNAKAIFANLDETEEYSFQIHSVTGQYCSDNSITQCKTISGRNKNQAEYIDKIYISMNYFRAIEFWGFQHCELDIKGTRAMNDGTTSEITDCRSYYVISDDDVQNKTYHNHHLIFYWDVDAIGQSYALTFVEDDGSGTTDDIIASVDLISKAFIPQQYKTVWDKLFGTFQKVYEIAAKDEKIGTLQIQWHQPNNQRCEVHGSSFIVTMDHDKDGTIF